MLIIPIYIIWGIRDYKLIKQDRSNLIPSYRNTILFNIFLVLMLSILSSYTNFTTNFGAIGKGVEIYTTEMILLLVVIISVIFIILPIVTEKLKINLPQPANFSDLLPNTNQELLWFFVLVVSVAFGEELIFREFYFELLNDQFGLTGDTLLVTTAVIFGLAHSYQGVAGIIATFIMGLVLGKIFQTTESLMIPIILHFIIDIKFMWNILVKRYYTQH